MARIAIAIPLRWSDFDAYAHVNNAEMFRLLEEARIAAFWRSDDGSSSLPTAVLDGRPGAALMTFIVRHEIEYVASIPYSRSPIEVELWFGKIGGASAEICYELYSPAGVSPRVLHTRASTTFVMVEAASGKPQRITEDLRAIMAPYVEDAVQFTKRG